MHQRVNCYAGKKKEFGYFLFRLDRVVLHGSTTTAGRAATLCFRPAISAYSKKSYKYLKNEILLFHSVHSLTQVWLLLFVTMIAMVFLMSLFSKISSSISTKKNNSRDQLKSKFGKQSKTILNWSSSYSVYVINIITNQGKSYIVAPVYRYSFN